MAIGKCQICSGDITGKDADLFCSGCGFIVSSPAHDKPDSYYEITAEKVKKLMDGGREFVLLDVRGDEERAFSRIDSSVHIPIKVLAKNWFALDNRDLIITYCHHGGRALLAAKFLNQKGYTAKALVGGIDNWSRTVDDSVKKYNKMEDRGRVRVFDA